MASEIRAEAELERAMPAPANAQEMSTMAPRPAEASLAADLLAALGGRTNVRALQTCASRVRVDSIPRVNDKAIEDLNVRGMVRPEQHVLHVLIGPRAAAVAAGLAAALG